MTAGQPRRRALVVRGGWEGHAPVEATELFRPDLEAAGFELTVSDDLAVYQDRELLTGVDLIVQCWTDGVLTPEQVDGLTAAVHDGCGFAGWHGGIVAAFSGSTQYLRMVGGVFLFHPEEFTDYRVTVVPERAKHPIVAGLDGFDVTTEQYWMLTDEMNDVLATTVVEPGVAGQGPSSAPMPVVWTRRWGRGKVFFSAIGHQPSDLAAADVRALTARGLLWAARDAP